MGHKSTRFRVVVRSAPETHRALAAGAARVVGGLNTELALRRLTAAEALVHDATADEARAIHVLAHKAGGSARVTVRRTWWNVLLRTAAVVLLIVNVTVFALQQRGAP